MTSPVCTVGATASTHQARTHTREQAQTPRRKAWTQTPHLQLRLHTHSPQPTAHSPQHSPQPTAHSRQPTAHSPQPTAHSPQPHTCYAQSLAQRDGPVNSVASTITNPFGATVAEAGGNSDSCTRGTPVSPLPHASHGADAHPQPGLALDLGRVPERSRTSGGTRSSTFRPDVMAPTSIKAFNGYSPRHRTLRSGVHLMSSIEPTPRMVLCRRAFSALLRCRIASGCGRYAAPRA